jgi:hypothetical protein
VTTLGGWAGVFGTADGAGSAARFSNPNGIAVDRAGNILVADFYFNTIRIGYPPPLFHNPWFNAGQFGSVLTGPPGTPGLLVVEASTDLVSWLALTTNSLAPVLPFSDPNASVYSKRFYRARTP